MTDAAEPLVLAGARLPGSEALVDVHLCRRRSRRDHPGGRARRSPRQRARRSTSTAGSSSPACTTGTCTSPSGRWCRAGSTSRGAESAAAVAALVAASVDRGEPEVIGFGYRDGLWPEPASRAVLDAVSGDVPVVLVAADLHACWVNSAAARRYGFDEVAGASGVLREDDCFRLVRAARRRAPTRCSTPGSRDAAARPPPAASWASPTTRCDGTATTGRGGSAGGIRSLRVAFGVYTQHLDRAIAEGLRTGEPCPAPAASWPSAATRSSPTARSTRAPRGASTRTRASRRDETRRPRDGAARRARAAHAPGGCRGHHARPCTRSATGRTPRVLDAFEAVGCRGSIEHAQLLRARDVARFARLGVVASVQPEHAMDDRDVADRYWAGRTDRAFMLAEPRRRRGRARARLRRARRAARPVVAISAAVGRSRGGREPWHPEQAIEARAALAASTGGRGASVAVAARPTSRSSSSTRSRHPSTSCARMPVAATLLAGRSTHSALE